MRFNPECCPECGEHLVATCEMVPGNALVNRDEDGNYEYDGETKMCWDGQHTEHDDQGRAEVICDNGHIWYAEMED